jgi:NAD+ synthase (glutamine-hydrolysing)
MRDRFTVALAQTKPHLGDVARNLTQHEEAIVRARDAGADLVVFPELSMTGYHLKDDVPSVAQRIDGPVVRRLEELSRDITVVASLVEETSDFRFFNSALWIEQGATRFVHRKVYLPTYGMFDESRYFARGGHVRALDTGFGRAAVLVCEDLWHASTIYLAALDGALFVVCPSSSPLRGLSEDAEQDDNARFWELINRAYAQTYGLFVIYVNRVGFEDGVGFWGGSAVVDPSGHSIVKAPYYEPALVTCEIDLAVARRKRIASPLLRDEDIDLTLRELTRIRQGGPR